MARLLFTVVLVPVLSALALAATDLTGAWRMEWKPDFSGHDQEHECTFTQNGRKLAIDCDGATMKGEVNGRKVTFQHPTGRRNEATATYDAELDRSGTRMTGTWHLAAPDPKEGRFQAEKH